MSVEIINPGATYAGAPLQVGETKSFDPTTESRLVSSGYAKYKGDVVSLLSLNGVIQTSDGKSLLTVAVDKLTGRIVNKVGDTTFPADLARIVVPVALNVDAIGNSIVFAPQCFAKYACAASSGRLSLSQNLGVSGNNSTDILARAATVGDGSDVVVYLEGTNDATQTVPYATHAANTVASLKSFISRGKTPVMVLAPPNNAVAARVESLNVIDYVIAQALRIHCVQPWDSVVDVANGAYASGTTYSVDGIHPVDSVHVTAGNALWSSLSSASGPYVPLPRSNVGGVNAALVATNPLFLTDTNVDGVPDGWTKVGTGTISLVPDGLKGSWLKTSQSGAATAISVYRDLLTGWAVGDELLLVCRVKMENASNVKATLALYDNNSAPLHRSYWFMDVQSNIGEQVVVMKHTVGAGTTSIRLIVQLNTATSGNFSGDLSIAQAQVYNLTVIRALLP